MNNNWDIAQTKALFCECEGARRRGESLMTAFRAVAERTGRSVNSVRNYYYGQAKTFELVPEVAKKLGISRAVVARERFVPFTDSDIKRLLEGVLTARAKGVSVRRAILDLAGGDSRLALRYQNKYRSLLKSHSDTVRATAMDLAARGVPCIDPYARTDTDNFARLTEYIAALDEKRVGKFLALIEKLT